MQLARGELVPESAVEGRRRVIVERVSPAVDDGRFPAKRVVGDVVSLEADIFADGHDVLSAVVLHRHESEPQPREIRVTPMLNDRWRAEVRLWQLGFELFKVGGWVD